VIRGDSLASRLGFPTANIDPHHEVIPPPAIYATRIIFDNEEFKGICYIGARPTLSAQSKRAHIEVHIFNFNKIIYGKYLDIRFVKKIRPDKRFASLEFLSKQIKKDVILAKKILSCH
jgi:riboflavin kinase/FMN adenylyltransferase